MKDVKILSIDFSLSGSAFIYGNINSDRIKAALEQRNNIASDNKKMKQKNYLGFLKFQITYF